MYITGLWSRKAWNRPFVLLHDTYVYLYQQLHFYTNIPTILHSSLSKFWNTVLLTDLYNTIHPDDFAFHSWSCLILYFIQISKTKEKKNKYISTTFNSCTGPQNKPCTNMIWKKLFCKNASDPWSIALKPPLANKGESCFKALLCVLHLKLGVCKFICKCTFRQQKDTFKA